MDSDRHVIKRILNPHFLIQTISFDVACTIHQSLALGEFQSLSWDGAVVEFLVGQVEFEREYSIEVGRCRLTPG
jgi:hypothetical protein